MTPPLLLALALVSAPPSAPPPATAAASPSFLRELAETRGYRAGMPSRATVVPGGAEVIFLRSGPRAGVMSLLATDVATGKTRELITAEALLASEPEDLSDAEKARLERQRITARGITHYQMALDGRTFLAALGGRLYAVDRTTGEKRRMPVPQGALDPRLSPDGKQVAFVSGGELHVLDVATGKARALTTGATEWKTHGLAEFVAQEEMDRGEGYWWSPDSRSLAFEEADDTEVEKLSIQDPARPERRPVQFAYPRAGRQNTRVRLGARPLPLPGPGALAEGRAAPAGGPEPRADRGGGAPCRPRKREDRGPPRREGPGLAEPERGGAALDARRVGLPLVHRT
jgi:dipeptidyl-peptidase-4